MPTFPIQPFVNPEQCAARSRILIFVPSFARTWSGRYFVNGASMSSLPSCRISAMISARWVFETLAISKSESAATGTGTVSSGRRLPKAPRPPPAAPTHAQVKYPAAIWRRISATTVAPSGGTGGSIGGKAGAGTFSGTKWRHPPIKARDAADSRNSRRFMSCGSDAGLRNHRRCGLDDSRDVRKVGRKDHRVVRLREVAELRNVLLGELHVDGLESALAFDRLRDLADALRLRLGDEQDLLRAALGLVDLRLAVALRLRDHRALLALGAHLLLHRVADRPRRGDVLDFVARDLDSPGVGRLVDRRDDRRVDGRALLERTVEVELAHLGPHRRLRELRRREKVVADAVRGLRRIHHLHVEDAVDRHRDVVLRDALLRRHVDRLLLQRVLVGDAVEERHQDVETGVQRALVLAEPLHDVRRLLRHDHRGLANRDEYDKRDDSEEHERAVDCCQDHFISSTLNVRLFCEITLTFAPAAIGSSATAVHSASPTSTRPASGGLIAEVTVPTRPTYSLSKSALVSVVLPEKSFFRNRLSPRR